MHIKYTAYMERGNCKFGLLPLPSDFDSAFDFCLLCLFLLFFVRVRCLGGCLLPLHKKHKFMFNVTATPVQLGYEIMNVLHEGAPMCLWGCLSVLLPYRKTRLYISLYSLWSLHSIYSYSFALFQSNRQTAP